MGSVFRRVLFVFRRETFDRDLADELRFHEDMRARALADAEGMSGDEARAAARRRLGNALRLREQSREPWLFGAAETFAQDARHALRMMRRDPAFTFSALATLALGIGLNTAVFSVAYGVLWRPLPYAAPDRLVLISSAERTEKGGVRTFSTWPPATYEELRTRATALDHLAAYSSIQAQFSGRGEPRQLRALDVSPNFFATLGTGPVRGRAFPSGVASPGEERTAIVSDRLWRTSLGADPAIVGQSVTIDGLPRTVVGVLPPDFTFRPVIPRLGALPDTDIYLLNRWTGDAGRSAFLFLLGRMKPGVTRERAEAELTALANDPSIAPPGALAPEGVMAPNATRRVRAVGLQESGSESVRPLLLVLLGAVSFVLLIACVNVASLQMARLTARQGELSVRMALGAGRRRIVRQVLTEAVVLGVAGAALGVLLAWLAIGAALPLVPDSLLARPGGIAIDARVMVFCLGLSLVASVLVGLVPALRLGGAACGESRALHAGGARTTGDRQGERLRGLLVAAQIAMTHVLLIGAGLLMGSFVRLTAVSPGFSASGPDGVVQTVKVTLPERLYPEPERIHAFARGVLERIQHLPGVRSASLVNSVPFGMMFIQGDFEIEGRPKPAIFAGAPKIDPGYFETMGIRMLAGRDFTALDTPHTPKVAILSERVVRECFPGGAGEALGRRVRVNVTDRGEWMTVVGVVADVRQRGLDQGPQPMIYAPFQQDRGGFIRFVSFVARTAAPGSVAEGIRAEIRRAAPDLPIESSATMDEAVAASVAQPRFRMVLLGLLALAATLIATCGVYGLMAYAVAQRRREIGVRMVLGATRSDVIRLVLGRALRTVVAGLVAGVAGAAAVTRVLQRFLFGVTPTDPMVFTMVTLLLLAVGLAAAWLPARRAARIDPWDALRAE